MNFCVVTDGIIENIIVSDHDFAKSIGANPYYSGAEIGREYSPPPLPAPPPTNTELAAQLAQSDDAAISLYEKQLAQDTINAGMDDALIALYERGGTK